MKKQMITMLMMVIASRCFMAGFLNATEETGDGFEGGLGNWTAENGSVLYTWGGSGDNYATTGSGAARLTRNYGATEDLRPLIRLTNPLLLDSKGYTSVTITFAYKSATSNGTVKWNVQYSSNGGSSWILLGLFSAPGLGGGTFTKVLNEGTYTFTDNALFRIVANGTGGGFYGYVDDIVITGLQDYDADPPEIDTLSPTNTDVLLTPAFLQATFTEDIFTNAAGSITVTNISAGTSDTMGASELSLSGSILTITPDPLLEGDSTYAVLITANAIKDGADNFFAGFVDTNGWQFTTIGDTVNPGVATLSPANGASNIALSTSLIMTFDEIVVTNTGYSFAITNITDGDVYELGNSEISVAASNITFNPTSNLLPGKTYAVLINSDAVKDPFDNFFDGYASTNDWQFSTDGTPPALLTVYPSSGSTDIVPSADLVATFTEPIQAGSGNIVISNVTDSSTITISANDSSQVTTSSTNLIINPAAWLAFGKEFAVIIEANAILDLAELPFAGTTDADWRFSTKDAGYAMLDNNPLVPSDLAAGDTFHFAFVTSTEINWSDVTNADNVYDWDDYVNAQANSSLVSDVPDITWYAIVSTPSTNARDHAFIQGPVYLLNETQIASGYADMWDGDILATLSQTENNLAVGGTVRVWSGTNNDGTRESGNELGATDNAGVQGSRSATGTGNPGWIRGSTWFNTSGSTAGHIYALSEPIVIQLVPRGSVFRFR